MRGFITDEDLGQAEEAFPGITAFYGALAEKPDTFLGLVSRFEHWGETSSQVASPSSRTTREAA